MKQTRIVIAEDNGDVSRYVKSFLPGKGFTVFQSLYETVCRTYVQEKNIDLLLLVASYGAICRALKAAERIRELDGTVPIVMAVENSTEADVIAALRAGVNDFFKYPFEKEDLFRGIERCLSRKNFGKHPLLQQMKPDTQTGAQGLIG